jgi:4a-hydroxytetrahydrobiopterin dehydratase
MPRPDATPLGPDDIALALTRLPGWRYEEPVLARDYLFDTFPNALAWMTRAGFAAEALDHHPEWTNRYRRVSIRLCTHSAGDRVTPLDLELARRFELLANRFDATDV